MTKVAFPIDGGDPDAPVVDHFGRANNFLVFDTARETWDLYENPEAAGEETLPPNFLHQEGVDDVVCFGLGRRAVELFKKLSVGVYRAVPGSVKKNLDQFKEGNLDHF